MKAIVTVMKRIKRCKNVKCIAELDVTDYVTGKHVLITVNDPDLKVPRIIINKLDNLGRKCSMDQVTVVNGQTALRDIKNCEDIYHEAQIAFDKLKKYVAGSK